MVQWGVGKKVEKQDYNDLLEYLARKGALAWKHDGKMWFAVFKSKYGNVRNKIMQVEGVRLAM